MESSTGEIDKNGEELTGRKKSRFKQLKTRLFGKLKKKESEGLMKQSQSASDITAPEGGREGYDSEDDCLYPQCLSTRAMSHDSIFITDQTQSTEPTRVFSQENVHGKIKALQLKLQQQNLRLGPPPMSIPGKCTEDSGATSEDDGLPCSPPEMSFHERVMHGVVYKYPEPQKHLSCLSLAGTGSEEEEQGDPFQSSSRPLSPVSKLSPQPIISPTSALYTPSTGVDFISPVYYTPRLDNSAARHRMLIKPRNQRASTKGKKVPMVSLSPKHYSGSLNDLNNVLSEEDDDIETTMSTETMHNHLCSSPTLTLTEKPTSPEPQTTAPANSLPIQEEILTLIDIHPPFTDVETLKSLEPEEKVTANPLCLQPTPIGLTTLSSGRVSPSELYLESMQPSRDMEPFRAHSPIQRYEAEEIQPSREVDPLRVHSPIQRFVTKEILIFDEKRSQGSNENKGGIQAEALFKVQLVPVPQTKKTKMEIRNPPSPKGATEASQKPWEVGVESSTPELVGRTTAPFKGVVGPPSAREGDAKSQTLNTGAFQFSIGPAKYRSKMTSETAAKQDEGNSKDVPGIKMQSNKPNPEPLKDEAREMKPTELQLLHQLQETKSSNHREVISPVMSKPALGNHLKKAETSTEEPEDRKSAFGVQLRTTSESLRYRSEVSKIMDETKRYSLEPNQMLAASEEHAGKADTSKNMLDGNSNKKPSVPEKKDLQNLHSQLAATDNGRSAQDMLGKSKEAGSEPGWMSLAREKTRAYQPFMSRLATNQSPQVHTPPPTVPTSQPPTPTSQPKTQPATTMFLPLKTQHTLNAPIQTANQQSSQVTTPRSPTKPTPSGINDKQVSSGCRAENTFSPSAGGGKLNDIKDKSIPAFRISTSVTDATKRAAVPSKMEGNTSPVTPTNTELPTITSELSSSSSSSLDSQQQVRSDGAQPSWMELAKRKSLAWSDKTLEFI
ncbi:CRACD-like protein [Myxocyprinus asiaticus]|uniref:CRACD-like protein n=1 Tax=Myxocyprinus asiaticus TaxID=70543 RepID=UPI002221C747|nr:CRACD-like protein [Myxocyprinus asiaticus]XP_051560822.1 CRACD-like protein [Myxocyprinus asiaticus]